MDKYGIKARREKLGMSQEALSEKSKVSRQTIWMLENDKTDNVLVSTLASIARALETTVDDFFCNNCSND